MGNVKKLSMATAGAVLVSLGTGLCLGEPAKAASFTNIYAFGDSLTDTGNDYSFTLTNLKIGLPPSPYFDGRFSNGPVWVESLASKLGLTVTPSLAGGNNFAYGGAESGTENVFDPLLKQLKLPLLPGLQEEVESFIGGLPNQAADPNALYTVWAGANDYLAGGLTTDTATIKNLLSAVTSLNDVGAKNILVPNLPDLGKIPRNLNTPEAPALSALSKKHNSDLALALASLSQDRGSSINIIPLDVYSTFEAIIADPAEYGFTNVTQGCINPPPPFPVTYNSPCNDQKSVQDQYFSWDGIHPTEPGHQLIAKAAFAAVRPVPEPSSTLGILTFGVLGAGSLLKRRQKQQKQKVANLIKKAS